MAGEAPIRVGVIGASADRGWGHHAHVPAIRALPQYRLEGVATARAGSADRAAALFGAPLAFGDPLALIAHPDIDLVAITVKVPSHRDLALAAIAAGKHVYCEWPLGHGIAQCEEMAAATRGGGVRVAIGLQGRSAPALRQARDLVANGYVGRVLSTSLVVSAEHLLGEMPEELETLLYPQFGTTMFTVHFGHLMDMLCFCLGEFASLSATLATRRPEVTIIETGRTAIGTAPDHIALSGMLESGATATVHLRGGHSRGANAFWEINGTEGDLLLTGDHGNMHIAPLALHGGRRDHFGLSLLPIDPRWRWVGGEVPDGAPFNVAQTYALLADDIRTGSRTCPDFDDGLRRHRLLAAVEEADATGLRQSYAR